jgi:NADH-quinone oxidoreductase subunit H
VITMSGVMVTLFLGGPQPVEFGNFDPLSFLGPLEGTAWFVLKLFLFLYLYVWLRATLPRLRYDQLMDFGWKVLIPLAFGWFLLLAALREFASGGAGADSVRVTLIAVIIGAVAFALLSLALRVARINRERQSEQRPGVTT